MCEWVCVRLVVDVGYGGVSVCVGRCGVCVCVCLGVWVRGSVCMCVGVAGCECVCVAGCGCGVWMGEYVCG